MTCIIGLVDKGNVYMDGDSAGVAGLSITTRIDEKVFVKGPFIMGFTSSFRMGQLLHYKLEVPKQEVSQTDMEYMVTDFIDAVRRCFADNGFGKMAERSDNEGGTFIVGYNQKIYTIYDDFQVGESIHGYDSVGCGSDLALGSLYSTKGKQPEARVKMALEAASTFSAGVTPPFLILKQLKKK